MNSRRRRREKNPRIVNLSGSASSRDAQYDLIYRPYIRAMVIIATLLLISVGTAAVEDARETGHTYTSAYYIVLYI